MPSVNKLKTSVNSRATQLKHKSKHCHRIFLLRNALSIPWSASHIRSGDLYLRRVVRSNEGIPGLRALVTAMSPVSRTFCMHRSAKSRLLRSAMNDQYSSKTNQQCKRFHGRSFTDLHGDVSV